MEKEQQRNLILAIVISAAIFIVYYLAYERPRMLAIQADFDAQQLAQQQAAQQSESAAPAASDVGAETPTAGDATEVAAVTSDRASVIARTPRVAIESPRLKGSISLKGGRIDDVVLLNYRETIDPNSPNIILLSPSGAKDAYFIDIGWSGADAALPDAETIWQTNGAKLTPDRPVTLTWDNGRGLKFSRILKLDDEYVITVTQRVQNSGSGPVTLFPYGRVLRVGRPPTLGFFILHEGLIGVFDGVKDEETYVNVDEATGGKIEHASTGGWLGITDKYWMAAVVPDQVQAIKGTFRHTVENNIDLYQSSFIASAGLPLSPGGSVESTSHAFTGPKEVKMLARYEDAVDGRTPGITGFDLAIDWGWFYFLTEPIFYLMDYIYGLVGNFGVAILVLTVIIKVLFFPLANKSYKAMSRMKLLAPEMTKLRERFAEDKQRLNQEMMALYKREKVNPAAGCLPIVVQIPVFFALYKVLFITLEMRQAPFFGWIRDLSAPDPTSILNLFGALPWGVPDLGIFNLINLGVWPLIMGVTMFLQQKLNPPPPDPVQAKMFMALPFVFTFMLAGFPAGLVIYWAWNNILSICQQWIIMRQVSRTLGKPAPAVPTGKDKVK
ncbi:MAG: membrane protein insertase YidC [Dongiaceae bacterium]